MKTILWILLELNTTEGAESVSRILNIIEHAQRPDYTAALTQSRLEEITG